MIIAIDFDGTCVTHEFPKVGNDIGAAPVLRKLVAAGHKLILYTMRSNNRGLSPITNKMEDGGLEDAIAWFRKNNIELYSVQENPGQKEWTSSPKCYAQLYIDDAALGIPLTFDSSVSHRPYVDWEEVLKLLTHKGIL